MIEITMADGTAERELLKNLRQRSGETDKKVTVAVTEILEQVKADGDAAVKAYTLQFDGHCPEQAEVSREQMDAAVASADPRFVQALRNAMENIRTFHSRQKQQSFIDAQPNGVMMGQRIRGLKRVGLYVPGGTAAYPSSVLMNAIPAKIAGVEEVIMVTPPLKDGTANPDILVAAALAGVDRIFLMGGAQAVGALAYGTETVPKVDKIVGPGNIYVALAKREVFGYVGIDSIAGPSEILVIADGSADARYVAADVLSQAEHDPMAACICVSCDKALAQEILREIEKQMEKLSRRDIISRSLSAYGAVVVADNLEQAVEFSNRIAPEHLELCVEKPEKLLPLIKNAGAVFMGHYSPEPLGDYFAGPSHVLPTSGTARFFSPVNLDDFVKKTSVINYSREALKEVHKDIELFARFEGLTAHENSVKIRFEEE